MSKKLFCLIFSVVVLVLAGFARAELLTNGDFEYWSDHPDDPTWAYVTTIQDDQAVGWYAHVDIADDGWAAPWFDNGYEGYEHIVGTNGDRVGVISWGDFAATISQNLGMTFVEGTTYTFSVDIYGEAASVDSGGYPGEQWCIGIGADDMSNANAAERQNSALALAASNAIVGDNYPGDPNDYTVLDPPDIFAGWQTRSVSYTATAQDAGKEIVVFVSGGFTAVGTDTDTCFDNARFVAPTTIPVDPNSDIAAANALAVAGDTIEFAEGTYYITSQIEIKDGVTYKGAGPGLTIIDGNDSTRAFVAWGDRSFNNGNENANDSGPKGWVLDGMTVQNCVADTNDRFSYTGAAFNMKTNFVTLDVNESGGLDPVEANGQVGAIRLAGPDGTEGTEDDDLHRFAHIDIDGSGELSEAELDAQLLLQEDEFGDQAGNGGAIFIGNQAVGTIQNCDFLGNHTPFEGDGDDGGAINIAGLSVVTIIDCWLEGNYTADDGGAINIAGLSTATINDCTFTGNYAASPDSVAVEGLDGDGGHIKLQGSSASALTPGTTLVANRCVFLNGNASDDGGAIQSNGDGSVVRLDSCRFEGNTSWDNGNVCQFYDNQQNEVTVTNCIFVNNVTKADNSPDRMIETNRNSKFINCTFVGNNQEDQDLIYNVANVADTDGDGVDDETADATQVINCIFVNNVIGNGDDVLGSRNADFTIAATNCLFFGNTRQNGNDADNTQRPDEETGSVLDDPLLDAEYVPGAGSPAIDAGVDPATLGITLLTDYNGAARPQGAAYDIGAYEVVAAPPGE